MSSSFSADATLRRLKDFQRRTVDYVFQRLYLDSNPTNRFLVADEVGLGKTLEMLMLIVDDKQRHFPPVRRASAAPSKYACRCCSGLDWLPLTAAAPPVAD